VNPSLPRTSTSNGACSSTWSDSFTHLGQMTIAVMLETSGEASTPVGEWSTDGAWPIRGYLFGSQTYEEEQAAAAATVAGRALVSLPLVISICLFTMSAIMLVVNIALAASRSSSLV